MRNKTLVFLFILLLHGGLVLAQQLELSAVVEPVKGEVSIQLPGKIFEEIKVPTEVIGGTTIRTGAGSEAIIRWSNGNVVKLSSFTSLKMESLKKNFDTGDESSQVFLWNGSVVTRAKALTTPNSSFQMRTPSAVAGVRGTKFKTDVTSTEESQFLCTEGEIEVTAQGEMVTLQAGTKTTVEKGGKPKPPQAITEEEKTAVETVQELQDPMLEVDAPVGNLVVEETPIMVLGHSYPNTPVTVQDKVTTSDSSGAFSIPVDLELGTNVIRISVTGPNGGKKTITRAIKYRPKDTGDEDKIPPLLVITSPAAGARTGQNQVTVVGKTEPGASVTVNGTAVTVSAEGLFQTNVSLAEGENNIYVTATDADNNTASANVLVVRDTTAPVLTITEPPKNFSVRQGEACEPVGTQRIVCRVSGFTEPGAILKINGVTYPVETDGSFVVETVMSYTASEIRVEASDDLRNINIAILKRAVDYTQPCFVTLATGADVLVSDKLDTTTVTVTVKNFLQEPIAGAQVILSLSSSIAGTLSPASGVTDANGVFRATLRSNSREEMIIATLSATAGEIQVQKQIQFMPSLPVEPD